MILLFMNIDSVSAILRQDPPYDEVEQTMHRHSYSLLISTFDMTKCELLKLSQGPTGLNHGPQGPRVWSPDTIKS